MSYHSKLSHDGYIYTKHDGLIKGLRTYGVIQPASKIRDADANKVWDVIVIGAGYTGLIAARDLVKAGKLIAIEYRKWDERQREKY